MGIIDKCKEWATRVGEQIHLTDHTYLPRSEHTQRTDSVDGSYDTSIGKLKGRLPLHPSGPPTYDSMRMEAQDSRSKETVVTDTQIDMTLVNLSNQIKNPKDILKGIAGKEGTVAYNDDLSIIAIRDNQGKLHAFKTLLVFNDVDSDQKRNPASTGFSACAFAEIKLDKKYASPQELVDTLTRKEASRHPVGAAGGAMAGKKDSHEPPPFEFEPRVRTCFQGFQYNYEGCTSPGQIDRGELPNQLSRVLDFDKKLTEIMRENHMPPETVISATTHSLGNIAGIASRDNLMNNPELSGYRVGPMTVVNPVAESAAVRQYAVLKTGLKTLNGQKTDVETELTKLTNNVDLVVTQQDYTRLFLVGHDPNNNKMIGTRLFEIQAETTSRADRALALTGVAMATGGLLKEQLKKTIDDMSPFTQIPLHPAASVAKLLAKGAPVEERDVLKSTETITPRKLAEEPKETISKGTIDGTIQKLSIGWEQFQFLRQDRNKDREKIAENYNAETIEAVAKTVGATPEAIHKLEGAIIVPGGLPRDIPNPSQIAQSRR